MAGTQQAEPDPDRLQTIIDSLDRIETVLAAVTTILPLSYQRKLRSALHGTKRHHAAAG